MKSRQQDNKFLYLAMGGFGLSFCLAIVHLIYFGLTMAGVIILGIGSFLLGMSFGCWLIGVLLDNRAGVVFQRDKVGTPVP